MKSFFAILVACCTMGHLSAYEFHPSREGKPPTQEEADQKGLEHPQLRVEGGPICWKGRVSNSQYALRGSSERFALPCSATMSEVEFNFDLGYRIGLGLFIEDDWLFGATYTSLKSDVSDKTFAGRLGDLKSPVGFTPSLTHYFGGELFFKQASSSYDIKYRTLDAFLSKPFAVSRLTLTPQLGLEGAILSAKQRNYYSGGSQLESNTLHVEKRGRYWGVGPKSALSMAWSVRDGLSLIQDVAFSLLAGDMETQYHEALSNQREVWSELEARSKRLVPHLGGDIGLGYKSPSGRIGAKLLFEVNYLWNFSQKVLSGHDLDSGGLYLYGASLDLKWEF